MGHKLSIITSKAQTTRHRILAILNEENYQLVISDTPGIIKPAHKLHETMMDFVSLTTEDADILLYVVEYKDHNLKDEKLFSKIKKINIPVILVINKIDLIDQKLNGDINVTSPTGLKTYYDLSKINLAKTFWKGLRA